MDNYIYDQIADYNDWVHLQRPAGGVTEMEKLKGGKMKEWIKKVKKDRSVMVDGKPADKYMTIIGLNDIIDKLITEIESRETEIKQLQAVREALIKLIDCIEEPELCQRIEVELAIKEARQILAAKGKDEKVS